MGEYQQLCLQCPKCQHESQIFYGVFQSKENEILLLWRCGSCKKDCIAVIASIVPVFKFTDFEDEKFLKSCNIKGGLIE